MNCSRVFKGRLPKNLHPLSFTRAQFKDFVFRHGTGAGRQKMVVYLDDVVKVSQEVFDGWLNRMLAAQDDLDKKKPEGEQ